MDTKDLNSFTDSYVECIRLLKESAPEAAVFLMNLVFFFTMPIVWPAAWCVLKLTEWCSK